MPMQTVIAAFYKFVSLPDCASLRTSLKAFMLEHDIKGTTLLAPEGINGTVSGSREAIDAFLAYLKKDARLTDLEHKESLFDRQPFERTKVKLKKEVISLGVPVFPHERVGTYVAPSDWNELISDPEMLVIDTRNSYEYHLGKFKNAVDPVTRKFNQLPEFVREHLDPAKHRKVAMYCTGGIRCEKFSSYLVDQGFEEVYHLKGGILKYLEEVPPEQSLWEGSCYVFDERVAVDHGLTPADGVGICPSCGHSLFTKDRLRESYVEGVSCPYCPVY